ncbi:hypothetical protein EVAR_22143_1 [Eumeta japonica]|uniref:Uncharacterized protein n=1 Tax=Eumeta variegata TaxID=151549 RepID=A0A4C1W186_EUMVA|nr:hypothetical protein EVAR_22143_1 [Eumeta japonica]
MDVNARRHTGRAEALPPEAMRAGRAEAYPISKRCERSYREACGPGFAFDSDSGPVLDSVSLQNIRNSPAAPPTDI